MIGFCSGGRQAYMAACRVDGIDAAVDCWGGGVVAAPNELNERQPQAPIDMTPDMRAPLLGIFGNEDANPDPAQVNTTEAALKQHGKNVRVPPLRRRRPRLLRHRPPGLPARAGRRRLEEGVRVPRALSELGG